MKEADLTISAAALRVQVRSLADRFSGLMEVAGEEALRGETDPQLRRNRLLWLTNGIPAMQQALFQPDPLAAMLDAWFLIAQIRYYFDNDAAIIPPEILEVGHRLLDEMESDIKNILDNAGPDTNYERGRKLIYDAAADTPVDRNFASRRGSAALLAEFTATTGGTAFKSLGSVTETLDDLVARIDLNAEWIPKFARWQAMLLADEYGLAELEPALAHVNGIAAEVDALLPVIAAAPELVANERRAVLEAVDAYLAQTLAFVDSQRAILMQEDVRAEREAALAVLAEERALVLTALAEERRIILAALHDERVETLEDLQAWADATIARQVDRLFLRVLLLIVVLLSGLAILAALFVRALRRRDV